MSLKLLNYFANFDHPVYSNPNKISHKNIISWKVIITSFNINICFYLSCLYNFLKNSQGAKFGDQNEHFFQAFVKLHHI